jgi:hypothetical protein
MVPAILPIVQGLRGQCKRLSENLLQLRKPPRSVVRTHRGWLTPLVDQLPVGARRQAEDYLIQDRLVRRWQRPPQIFAAELRGYRDVYHPHLVGVPDQLKGQCDCNRRGSTCPHLAALALDLDRHPHWYVQTPWDLFLQTREWLAHPPLDWPDPWPWLPEEPLAWQKPYASDLLPHILASLEKGNPRAPLDVTWPIWADLHPSWLTASPIHEAFTAWLAARLPFRHLHVKRWVWLSWAQPDLDLAPVYLAFPESDAGAMVKEALALLFGPALWRDASGARQIALLKVVTWLDPALAAELWPRFPQHGSWVLAAADAYYQAGEQEKAQATLIQSWPEDPASRRAARHRLIAWLPLADSLPHRLALAIEERSLELLEPVRHLLSRDDWTQLTQQLKEHSQDAPPTDAQE